MICQCDVRGLIFMLAYCHIFIPIVWHTYFWTIRISLVVIAVLTFIFIASSICPNMITNVVPFLFQVSVSTLPFCVLYFLHHLRTHLRTRLKTFSRPKVMHTMDRLNWRLGTFVDSPLNALKMMCCANTLRLYCWSPIWIIDDVNLTLTG